jgi:SAM-dependent methyltransferase
MTAASSAEDYDAWYRTPRGRWIGETEYRLLRDLLQPAEHATVLDVGCGTGYFTRAFARDSDAPVVGVDPDRAWTSYARDHRAGNELFVAGRAQALPFRDAQFDYTISVTALCFVADPAQALRELVRVTRRRFVVGLLNRRSVLYWQKGRHGGRGAYRGARWHSVEEVKALFASLPVTGLTIRTAILFPHGGAWAQAAERRLAQGGRWGGFLAVAGNVGARARFEGRDGGAPGGVR